MTRHETFNIWAPPGAAWSAWVKPILFAHVDPNASFAQMELPPVENLHLIPPADGSTVIVIDLRGVMSVAAGALLAERGYRPIPLFNSVPSPTGSINAVGTSAVDVFPIIALLSSFSSKLDELSLPADAPPAFLLDSSRRVGSGVPLVPGMFDNRSVSLPTDFPSANLLLSRGFRRAMMVQDAVHVPQADLAHTLLRWQQAGLEMLAIALDSDVAPLPIRVTKPPFYRVIWQRLQATMNLRRNPLGGFGGVLPMPTSWGAGG